MNQKSQFLEYMGYRGFVGKLATSERIFHWLENQFSNSFHFEKWKTLFDEPFVLLRLKELEKWIL